VIAVTARAQLSCDDVEPLLSPCVDGELLDDDSASVKGHVARCDACRTRLLELQALKASLAAAGRTVELPLDLEARLHDDLRRAARPSRTLRAGLALAGAAAALAVVLSATSSFRTKPLAPGDIRAAAITGTVVHGKGARPPVVAAALQRHRADLPVDVASPDPRPVQEFLAQRLGHKLRVPRLESFGFGLQGGRVVDVDDRQGAQLMYAGGYGQRLSVVAVPDPDGVLAAKLLAHDAGQGASIDDEGLNVRVLSNNGAVYTIVGDVDEQRLDRVSHEITR
jgi:anti-sigma factor RsiW